MSTLTFRPAKPKLMRKVWVKWVDAVTSDNANWTPKDDFEPYEEGGLICESIGYVIHEDKKCIVLAQTCNESCIDNIITLPRGMVVQMKELREVGKRTT